MRIIEIDPSVDSALASICDAALRQGGLNMKANVDKIFTSVKEQVECKNA